jgi:hypothetical protein
MTRRPNDTIADLDARLARRRAREHLILIAVVDAGLLLIAPVMFFAGGDLGAVTFVVPLVFVLLSVPDVIKTSRVAFAPPAEADLHHEEHTDGHH